jgi:hypothetical protein
MYLSNSIYVSIYVSMYSQVKMNHRVEDIKHSYIYTHRQIESGIDRIESGIYRQIESGIDRIESGIHRQIEGGIDIVPFYWSAGLITHPLFIQLTRYLSIYLSMDLLLLFYTYN